MPFYVSLAGDGEVQSTCLTEGKANVTLEGLVIEFGANL